jgi:type VI secretion system protein ImpH
MADQIREQIFDLKDYLTQHKHQFSFYQMMRLLRVLSDHSDEVLYANTAIQSPLTFGFPACPISELEIEVDETSKPAFHVTSSILGLYGPGSPLPAYYTEDIMDAEKQDLTSGRAFLDMLQARLYQLLFETSRKYHLVQSIHEYQDKSTLNHLFSMAGFGVKAMRETVYGSTDTDTKSQELIRYMGLLCQFPKSALGLQTILRDAMRTETITIQPCCSQQIDIPDDQLNALGMNNNTLGENSIIGDKVMDRMGTFRISIGPISKEELIQFLPGNKGYETIMRLTNIYLIDHFNVDIEIIVQGEIKSVCLGDNQWNSLGIWAWLNCDEVFDEKRIILKKR